MVEHLFGQEEVCLPVVSVLFTACRAWGPLPAEQAAACAPLLASHPAWLPACSSDEQCRRAAFRAIVECAMASAGLWAGWRVSSARGLGPRRRRACSLSRCPLLLQPGADVAHVAAQHGRRLPHVLAHQHGHRPHAHYSRTSKERTTGMRPRRRLAAAGGGQWQQQLLLPAAMAECRRSLKSTYCEQEVADGHGRCRGERSGFCVWRGVLARSTRGSEGRRRQWELNLRLSLLQLEP